MADILDTGVKYMGRTVYLGGVDGLNPDLHRTAADSFRGWIIFCLEQVSASGTQPTRTNEERAGAAANREQGRCHCPDDSGDCEWCRSYYYHLGKED